MKLSSELRKYWGIYKLQMQRFFVFRFHFAIWIILKPLILVIYYFLWRSIFEYSGVAEIGGFTFQMMITYYLAQFVMDTWVGVDARVSDEIYKGNVTNVFIRPIKYFWEKFSTECAARTLSFFLQMIPVLIIAIFFFNFRIVSWEFTLLAIVSATLGMAINFCMSFNFALLTFWTSQYYGIRSLKEFLMYLFSGAFLPITLFPGVWEKVVMALPFPYIRFVHASIFVGRYTVPDALKFIGIQLIWVIVFYLIYLMVWNKAKRKFTGVGI